PAVGMRRADPVGVPGRRYSARAQPDVPAATGRRHPALLSFAEEKHAVKFLHTADWHVGKTLKGRDRLDEQRAVLAEIAAVAEANEVDAVLGAGDPHDLSAPSAAAQQLVVQTLLRIRQAGAEVIVIAGNHDHGPTFEAYRPLMSQVGITLVGAYKSPDRGGVVRFTARSDGAPAQLAVLPFLSQRY